MKLGDLLEKFFKFTGIYFIVKLINPNCNCDKRKEFLNEFEFKRK
jgi:hypothetical protein